MELHILITSGQPHSDTKSEETAKNRRREKRRERRIQRRHTEQGRDEEDRPQVRLVFTLNATKILQEL